MKLIKNVVYESRNIMGSSRLLFPLLKFRFKDNVISLKTDICIEGPPRSANSFFINAFRLQNPCCQVAHHIHVPLQVLYAVQHRIPCVVLLREPSEVLSSLIIADEDLSLEIAIKSYINFYQKIQHCRSNIIIAKFYDVINDFSNVIARVNTKYDTKFNHFPLTKEDEATIFGQMEKDIIKNKQPYLLVPVPKGEKETLKARVKKILEKTPSFREAQAIYDEWASC